MQIEKDVPIPKRSAAHQPRTEAGRIGERMEVGDSALFDSERVAITCRAAIQRIGGKALQRKMHGGWRVWRIA